MRSISQESKIQCLHGLQLAMMTCRSPTPSIPSYSRRYIENAVQSYVVEFEDGFSTKGGSLVTFGAPPNFLNFLNYLRARVVGVRAAILLQTAVVGG